MKPTNSEESGCSPISSNCVIWQGPTIECISLCKGDTVSTVVAKLAAEFCTLQSTFNIDNFDFSCLNLGDCGPEDFAALIQALIDAVCAAEGIPVVPGSGAEGCPDCTVNIAECFYYQNPQGDTVTTMQLIDYVTAIGNQVCSVLSQIGTINNTLTNHENRIDALETAPPPTFEMPAITPVCVLPAVSTDLDVVVTALETQFCELIGATGQPIDIYTALQQQCLGIDSSNQLAGSGTMGNVEGWQAENNNLASAINNIWLTLCDVRAAIMNIQANCCPSDCDSVDVTMTGTLATPTSLTLFFNGVVPSGFVECNGGGTSITITDTSGGSITTVVPIISNLNNALGYAIDLTNTPINGAQDLTITGTFCLDNGNSKCNSVLSHFISNTAACPIMNISPSELAIGYQFGWTGGAASFKVDLLDSSGTSVIQTQITAAVGPMTVINAFTGLNSSTPYTVRLTITADGTDTTCPLTPATTLAAACTPPINVTANLTIP